MSPGLSTTVGIHSNTGVGRSRLRSYVGVWYTWLTYSKVTLPIFILTSDESWFWQSQPKTDALKRDGAAGWVSRSRI